MDRKLLNLVALSGAAAVGLYVAAVVLGGVLDPTYSHVRNAISELTASRAPASAVLAPIFVAYNLALLGFSFALMRAADSNRLFQIAVGIFAVGALSGVGQVTVFRMDSVGTPATTSGAVHIALAGISSILTVAGTILYGVAFRRSRLWRRMSVPSFVASAAILLSAPGAALSIGTPLMGLFERVTIGCFMLWVVMVSAFAWTTDRGARRTTLQFGP